MVLTVSLRQVHNTDYINFLVYQIPCNNTSYVFQSKCLYLFLPLGGRLILFEYIIAFRKTEVCVF